jgi:pimeloyl-ACP methyl ester carboxylesterase
MPHFIPWNSQPLEEWAARYAQGKFVDLGGRQTHYVEQGEGEPVILLHGFFFDSYLWSRNIDALARKFKVYALDLWGYGYSTREPLDYGYPLYSGQLLQFMDALGIAQASLVGQSMGGGTAIQFSVDHRERVEKLVLVSSAGMPNPMPRIAKLFNLPHVGEFFMGLNTDAIRRKGLGDIFIHDKGLITDDFFEQATRPQKIRKSLEVGLAITRKDFFDKLGDQVGRLAQLDVPTLIVWGREDKGTPLLRCGQEMHRVLKGSRLEVLDDAGHVPNFEKADPFNRLVLDFLGS